MDIYEKGKGNNYINNKKAFLLVQITHDVNSKQFLKFFQSNSHNNCFLIFASSSWTRCCPKSSPIVILSYFFFQLIDFQRGVGKSESMRERKLLSHLLTYSLVDFCMCPDGDQIHNLGVLGRSSNQLNYLAKGHILSHFNTPRFEV